MYDHNYEMDYRPEPTLLEKVKEFMTYQTFLCLGMGISLFIVLYKLDVVSFIFFPLILVISIATAYFVQTSSTLIFNNYLCFFIGSCVIFIGLGIVEFKLWDFPHDFISLGFWLYSLLGMIYVFLNIFSDENLHSDDSIRMSPVLYSYFRITVAILFAAIISILFDFFVLTIIAMLLALIPAIKGIYEFISYEEQLYKKRNNNYKTLKTLK